MKEEQRRRYNLIYRFYYGGYAENMAAINDIAPIMFDVPGNTTYVVENYTASGNNRKLLVTGHGTRPTLRGIYLVITDSIICPIVQATDLEVSINADHHIVVKNNISNTPGCLLIN